MKVNNTSPDRKLRSAAILSAIILMFSGCVSSKLLKENEYLFAGSKVKVHAGKEVKGKGKLEGLLKDETYPLPNRRILGLPVKLWIYSVFKSKKNNSFISNTYGERPVLLTDVPIDEVSLSLQTVLKANGYLDSEVSSEIVKTRMGKRQRKVLYHCYVEAPYVLRNVSVGIDDRSIAHLLDSTRDESLVRPNDQYNLAKLKSERERIDALLKSHGYYYFSPDFLIYKADSSRANRSIDLSLRFKQGIPLANIQPWHVNDVFFFDTSVKDSLTLADTVNFKGVTFLTGKMVKPKLFRHFILFGKDDLLTTDKYNITNKNLSSLGVFRYTNMDAVPDSGLENKVNLTIDVTPNVLHNFSASADLFAKSNDFAGPGVEVAYKNRNLLGGGEQLTIKANGSVEAWLQKSDDKVIGNYNYELGGSAELRFPRFLFIRPDKLSPRFIPNNHIRLDYRYINQMQYYQMSFFRLLYGYRWAENLFRSHELNFIDITYQHMIKTTIGFDTLVNKNPLLEQSFADQFMVGTNYTFRYSVPDNDPRKFRSAFTGSIDLSGNLLYGLQKLGGKKSVTDEPLKFLGTTYSQYIKTTVDYRIYWDNFRKNRVAARVSVGLGLPVGNSGTLPGIKQYYLGGANSIRAFRFRSVGPGAYAVDKNEDVLINHSGEIMLLTNLENRYRLARSFEWALFLDAGNIWLAKDDPLRTGAQFNGAKFLKQLAVGWGTGLRYINQYFTIRVDVGFPLHSPNRIEKVSDMNTVWNFAIGYPF
jgi:outer membrane protein assembly factor BamA